MLFSALTTGTAFGSLALSAHPGTASMGELLLISLGCTLMATLVFIPALLASRRTPVRELERTPFEPAYHSRRHNEAPSFLPLTSRGWIA